MIERFVLSSEKMDCYQMFTSIYSIISLIRKLQTTVLAQSSWEIYLKLFVSTVIPLSHVFAFLFGVANFLEEKPPKN